MQTPEEKVLDACCQIFCANRVAQDMEKKWTHIFVEELFEYSASEILYEDYLSMLPYCIELLEYILEELAYKSDISWLNARLNEAKDDRVFLGNARLNIVNQRQNLDNNLDIFDSLIKNHGIPGNNEIANAVLIGEWENQVRQVMEAAKHYSRKAAEIHVAMNK